MKNDNEKFYLSCMTSENEGNKTYVEILQLVAIGQIQIDLIDTLIDKKVLRQESKYLAKRFQENIEKFQKAFFSDSEIITENDKLIEFLKEETDKMLNCIKFEIKDYQND